MGYQESNKHLINICCLPDSKSCLGYALYLPLLQSRCSNEFLFFNEGKRSCNSCILVTQSCPTLLDLMDCSPPGSWVCGILQARILKWAVISFSRESSRPGGQTCTSCLAGGFFTTEPPGKPLY